MLQRFKILGWAMLAAGVLRSASAFTLMGPTETWQVGDIGYNGPVIWVYNGVESPHNLGEEFRWNIPVMYYAIDQSFSDYFGAKGEAEIDAAFAMFNGVMSNGVSSWTADLSEFPLEVNGSELYRPAAWIARSALDDLRPARL